MTALDKESGSDKCFTVNKVREPCAMTLFPDNDTSVKRSKDDGAIPMWAFLPKATCRIQNFVKKGIFSKMADKDLLQECREYFAQQRKSTITLNGKQIKAYDIRSITPEQFRMLIACGHDDRNNQIRVTKSGMVYLSEDSVGAEQLDDAALCFETFSAHNGYVGVKAAEDDRYVMSFKGKEKDGACKHLFGHGVL